MRQPLGEVTSVTSTVGSVKSAALRPPAPLVVAASLAAVEGLVLVGYGVLELFHTSGSRWVMGLTTSVWFLAYGAALMVGAWALHRGRSWARSPVVLAQLIQLGVAWSFRSGETRSLAAGLVVVSLITLVGILHPASTEFLSDEDDEHA